MISVVKSYNNKMGQFEWRKDNVLHNDNDAPAIVKDIGTKMWIRDGRFSRLDSKPTIELSNGIEIWYSDVFIAPETCGCFDTRLNESMESFFHLQGRGIRFRLPDDEEDEFRYAEWIQIGYNNALGVEVLQYGSNRMTEAYETILISKDYY